MVRPLRERLQSSERPRLLQSSEVVTCDSSASREAAIVGEAKTGDLIKLSAWN